MRYAENAQIAFTRGSKWCVWSGQCAFFKVHIAISMFGCALEIFMPAEMKVSLACGALMSDALLAPAPGHTVCNKAKPLRAEFSRSGPFRRNPIHDNIQASLWRTAHSPPWLSRSSRGQPAATMSALVDPVCGQSAFGWGRNDMTTALIGLFDDAKVIQIFHYYLFAGSDDGIDQRQNLSGSLIWLETVHVHGRSWCLVSSSTFTISAVHRNIFIHRTLDGIKG